MTSEYLPSVCPHDCPSACALEVERLDPCTIGKIRGAKENNYTQGVICAKVSRYAERVHHPDRLTRPMRRAGPKGSGRFEHISWDQALDEVAENFARVADESGAEAIWPYYYGGTMGQLQRDGINRLRHTMGYSRQKPTICTTPAYSGWMAGTGAVRGADPRQMSESDLIVIWGGNVAATQVNVMTLISEARRRRGARLVVIDPEFTETAKQADLHLQLKPGTDGALACAVMQQLIQHGYADSAYLEKYTDFSAQLATHLRRRDCHWAAAITGVPAKSIETFSKLFGETKRSFIRLGFGLSRSRNGAHNVHAVSCLAAMNGSWQYRGGGALLGTSGLFHLDKTLIEGLDSLDHRVRLLDMSRIGSILCGDRADLQQGPPVKALLIQNSNPMAVAPDLGKVHRGFSRKDLFVCVHEQFMTETARMADVLLPATGFLEHLDLYQSYGQMFLQIGRPVIAPPGACRSNHWVVCELAKRLGTVHPGFTLSEEQILEATLENSDYPPLSELGKMRWLDCSRAFEETNFLNGFAWPDGRFRFRPDWKSLGPYGGDMPAFPDHWEVIDSVDARYSLRLITPPARHFLNTSFSETGGSRRKEGNPRLHIHTHDAEVRGIDDGTIVEISSRTGSLRIEAVVKDSITPGTVSVHGVWPGRDFPDGVGINALVSADPVAPDGGVAYHDTAVSVVAIQTGEA